MVDVLLILWDTKYFYGWRTVDTLRYSVLRPSLYWLYCPYSIFVRVGTQFPVFLGSIMWLYCMLKEREQNKKNVCVLISLSHPFVASSILSVSSFLFFWFFPLSESGTFLSLSFEWHADARCPSHDVQILMPFLSLCKREDAEASNDHVYTWGSVSTQAYGSTSTGSGISCLLGLFETIPYHSKSRAYGDNPLPPTV